MRRLRVVWLPALLVTAGCLSGSDTQDGATMRPPLACPAFPDGTPFPCGNATIEQPGVQAAAPTPGTSGWLCIGQYRKDTWDATVHYWRHDDGRAGTSWDWAFEDHGGQRFITIGLYWTAEEGTAIVVPYQEVGFLEWPKPPPSERVEVSFRVIEHQLDLRIAEGAWTPDPTARLAVGNYRGEPWFVWTFDSPRGTEHVDVMSHNGGSEHHMQWSARTAVDMAPDRSVTATVWGRGFHDDDMETSVEPTLLHRCAL